MSTVSSAASPRYNLHLVGFIPDNSGQRKGSEDNELNCNRDDKK